MFSQSITVTVDKTVTLKELFKYLLETHWLYTAGIVPVFVVLLVFYVKNKKNLFRNFSSFIRWIKPAYETGGYSSPEKLTAFGIMLFSYIPSRLIFVLTVDDAYRLLIGSCIDAVFILVLFKIIEPAQIIELKNGIKPSQENGEQK